LFIRDGNHFFAELSGETLAKTSLGAESWRACEPRTGHHCGERVRRTLCPWPCGYHCRVVHLKSEGGSWITELKFQKNSRDTSFRKVRSPLTASASRWRAGKIASLKSPVIPYTYEHTNIRDRIPGDAVNLEADILAKHIERFLDQRGAKKTSSLIKIEDLVRQGFRER